MQSAQAEHLRKLIESSTILTPAEKADWLDMLILMNDKQSSELEQILKARQPAPAPQPIRAPGSGPVPPLTHISNLPTDFMPGANVGPVPTPRPVAKPPTTLPWQKQFEATMAEKELSAPQQRSEPRAAVPPTRPGIVPRIPTPAPLRRETIAEPDAPLPAPTPRRSRPEPVILEALPDAGKLTVGALRSMDFADLLLRLQQLAKMEGYFNLLSYLEDSALYKSYLLTGQKVLAGKASFDQMSRMDPQTLSKAEFEAFADILRKIQIN